MPLRPLRGRRRVFAEDAPRLRTFAELFTYGAVGDVCADSDDGFFQAAIDTIDAACQNFDPPG